MTCSSPGCLGAFESLFEWPVAFCTGRAQRILALQAEVLADQGNVGDDPLAHSDAACDECGPDDETGKPHPATHRCNECGKSYSAKIAQSHTREKATQGHALTPLVARPSPHSRFSICSEHGKEIVAAEGGTHRVMCFTCVVGSGRPRVVEGLAGALKAAQADAAAVAAEAAKQKARLLELKVDVDADCAVVNKWAEEETARIREWEEREVKAVHSAAEKFVALVEEARTRRQHVATGILAQSRGLAATLDEIEIGLRDLPADGDESIAKTIELMAERKRLLRLLGEGRIYAAASDVYSLWAELPSLKQVVEAANGQLPHRLAVESVVSRALKSNRLAPSFIPYKLDTLPALRALVSVKMNLLLECNGVSASTFLHRLWFIPLLLDSSLVQGPKQSSPQTIF